MYQQEHRDVRRFSVTIGRRGEAPHVRLAGELDIDSAPRLRDVLSRLGGSPIVVDASRLRFVDAAGLSPLGMAARREGPHGAGLVIRGAAGIVRTVIELGGLGALLDEVTASPYGSTATRAPATRLSH